MRWMMGYNNCLIIGADPTGLYLATVFLFRVGHQRLLVPWHEISVTRVFHQASIPRVQLSLGRNEQIPFVISGKLAVEVQAAAGASWPVESTS